MQNRRRLQHTQRARVEHDLTLSRIGELTERDVNLLTRSLLYSLSGKKAAFIEGLIASPGVGLSVDLTAPASVIQNIGDGILTSDVKLVTDENIDGSAFNIALATADPTNPRIDIIEGTIKVRSAFTDSAVDVVDAGTKTITPTTRDRDFELYLELRKVDGTPAGSPTPPSTTAATSGSIVSTIAIPTTIDLSTKNILNIAIGKDSEYTEIDCSGAVPSATTVIEIRDAINAALSNTPASVDGGNHIVLTAPGTGELSIIKFKQPTDPLVDAYDIIMGGALSNGYFDTYSGENAYFKVVEIFVPATATSLTADNVRSREEKDTLWDSDAPTIINSLTFQEHRDSLPADHVAGSIDYSHLSANVIAQLTAVISSLGTAFRGANAVVYPVTGDATFQKGTLFKHDEELVTAAFVSQLDSDFEQEFPTYRVDQRQDDITGGSTYAVPISLSELAGDKWAFIPGTLINDGTNYYQIQTAYGTNARIGIYLKNGATSSGYTHLEVDIHDVADTLLGSVQIPLSAIQAVDIGWIYDNITLSTPLSLSTSYHLHFHLIGETAPTTVQLALDVSNTNLAYRQMYLPTAGKYGGVNESDVLQLLDGAGSRLVGIRATGADDISSPGDGFLGFATGSNYDFVPVDFSNDTFWTNWIYEDYIGVDRSSGRIKVPSSIDVRELYAEFNVVEPIGDLDAKHFLLHEPNNPTETKSIDDYLADKLDDNINIENSNLLYNAKWNGVNYRYTSNAIAERLDLSTMQSFTSALGTIGAQITSWVPVDNHYHGIVGSPAVDAVHDVTLSIGVVPDSTYSRKIILTSTLTKQIDAVHAIGDNLGGRAPGESLTPNTEYGYYVSFYATTGVTDAFFSTYTGAGIPNNVPSGVTHYRMVHWVETDGSSQIIQTITREYAPGIRQIHITTPVADINLSNILTTTRRLDAIGVPTGFESLVNYIANIHDASTSGRANIMYPGTSDTAIATQATTGWDQTNVIATGSFSASVLTNSSRQIASKSTVSNTDTYLLSIVSFIWRIF